MEGFSVRVDSYGRILLPAHVRKRLKLQHGSELIARVEKEQLVLRTRTQALRDVQEYFSQFRPKSGKLLSEELIEDRRAEARREGRA
jgi:AbrB family looped-hinge helix DNA binding protein